MKLLQKNESKKSNCDGVYQLLGDLHAMNQAKKRIREVTEK